MGRALAVPFWQDSQGNVVAGLSVDIVDPHTRARIPDTIYADDTSTSTITLPVTTGIDGKGPPLWITAGKMAMQKVTIDGVDYFDYLPFVDPTASGGGTGGSGGPVAAHTHIEGDVSGLPPDLASKAPLVHTHTEDQIGNLGTDLAGKANLSHTHAETDIGNLQADLNGKAASVHTHTLLDSKTGGYANPASSPAFPIYIPAFEVPPGMTGTITALRDRRDGGTGTLFNARRIRAGVITNLLSTDHSITSDSTTSRAFGSAGTLAAGQAFQGGDIYEFVITSVTGTPTYVGGVLEISAAVS